MLRPPVAVTKCEKAEESCGCDIGRRRLPVKKELVRPGKDAGCATARQLARAQWSRQRRPKNRVIAGICGIKPENNDRDWADRRDCGGQGWKSKTKRRLLAVYQNATSTL